MGAVSGISYADDFVSLWDFVAPTAPRTTGTEQGVPLGAIVYNAATNDIEAATQDVSGDLEWKSLSSNSKMSVNDAGNTSPTLIDSKTVSDVYRFHGLAGNSTVTIDAGNNFSIGHTFRFINEDDDMNVVVKVDTTNLLVVPPNTSATIISTSVTPDTVGEWQVLSSKLATPTQYGVVKKSFVTSVYSNTNQSSLTSAAEVKVQLNTVTVDQRNSFDNTTNYRFQPDIAGYYQVNLSISVDTNTVDTGRLMRTYLKKNGTTVGFDEPVNTSTGGNFDMTTSKIAMLVYLNGSTDYLEVFTSVSTTSGVWAIIAGADRTRFDAFWVTD